MCGIVGYFGNKDSVPILINGLKRLEYRGYDSAGLVVIGDDQLHLLKKAGKVSVLESEVDDHVLNGTVGMAHTRWATHGEPNDINAHPHTDQDGKIALIHNGIIENYNVLKQVLEKDGVKFQSETDSEVLVQLISKIYYTDGLSFPEAVQAALQQVVGAYGIVAICKDEPEIMVAARHGSPLVLGVGEGEYFVASDASPIIEHTRNVVYLDEGEMVVLKNDGYTISQIKDKKVVYKDISIIEHDLEAIEKGNFPHFMLKEIHEQVNTITDTMRGRLQVDKGYAFLGGLSDYMTRIENAKRFYITACGTSWHAGLIGKYLLEEYAGIPVYVEYASEFRYRRTIIDNETIVIAISQSGETADTLAAIKKAKEKGGLTLGICNVVGSSITRITDCGVYTHAGPEIGVASTKAFTAQVTVLSMLALLLGRKKGMSKQQGMKLSTALANVGKDVKTILSDTKVIEKIAWEYEKVDNFLYLGRGVNFPVALEGALKLKEISYIHAEGYPAAEMKHGPIALIDEKMPVLFIVPHDQTYEKVLSNIQEVQARKGRIIILTDKKSKELEKLSDHIIEIPQ
ncbi:MAG TPA: glutamine--fructose-6-phosphate transaminase (isomerizing), partial [Candidatus Marinimicrobia bacterium]|nr:glutamine--fructose-6-phosphate transaminase (isomerizing) [Candidatus Neomarinimicrobiota bacterium]